MSEVPLYLQERRAEGREGRVQRGHLGNLRCKGTWTTGERKDGGACAAHKNLPPSLGMP